MPYNLHVIRTSDFVRFDGHGVISLARTHEVLRELATACVERGIDCVLLDTRGVTSKLTHTELYELARAFPEMGFAAHHKLAILHHYVKGDRAELFAHLATARGWNVRAFDNFEEAIDWFAQSETVR